MKIDRKTTEIGRKKIELFLILSLIVFFLVLFFCTSAQFYKANLKENLGLYLGTTQTTHWIYNGFLCIQLFWMSIILYFIGIFRIKIGGETRDFAKIVTYVYLSIISLIASYGYVERMIIPILFRILIDVHYSQAAKLRKEKSKHKEEIT